MSFGSPHLSDKMYDSEGLEVVKTGDYSSQGELDDQVVEFLSEGNMVMIEPDGRYGHDCMKDVSAREAVVNARKEYREPVRKSLKELVTGGKSWTSLLSPSGKVEVESYSDEMVLLSKN